MSDADLKKQKQREAARERKRLQREREREQRERLGMAPTHIDLAEGERRRWLTQAQARGYDDPAEYLVALLLQDEQALVMMGVDLSQFQNNAERDSHATTNEVA